MIEMRCGLEEKALVSSVCVCVCWEKIHFYQQIREVFFLFFYLKVSLYLLLLGEINVSMMSLDLFSITLRTTSGQTLASLAKH